MKGALIYTQQGHNILVDDPKSLPLDAGRDKASLSLEVNYQGRVAQVKVHFRYSSQWESVCTVPLENIRKIDWKWSDALLPMCTVRLRAKDYA